MGKGRLFYFDMLKGIAIFMVVMGHVMTMCVREIDSTPLFKFVENIHMPLFFFISGWFTYKCGENGRILAPAWGKRALQLLLPMVVVSSLWIWYFPHSRLESPLDSTFAGLWSNEWKNGYWFTLVLFEILVLYAATIPLLKTLGNAVACMFAVLALWGVAQYAVLEFVPEQIASWGSLTLAVQFYPVFVAGAIARRHSDGFLRFTASPTWFAACLVIGAFLLYWICWSWEIPEGIAWIVYPARVVFRLCLAVVAIGVVRPWAERAFGSDVRPGSGLFARAWQYLGTQSLAVYLLHYFFLFPMGGMRETLTGFGLGFVPMLVFSAVVASAIISVTLAANYIISRSPVLALLLTGKR